MKANELMIGDWLTHTYVDYLTKETVTKKFRVMGYDNMGYLWSESGRTCYPEEADGIPLTPEILEKNGFEKRNNYQWEYRDGYCKIVISIAPQIEIDGEILGAPPINVGIEGALFELNRTDDWYIHEFQHALRLCGIDKEIVL